MRICGWIRTMTYLTFSPPSHQSGRKGLGGDMQVEAQCGHGAGLCAGKRTGERLDSGGKGDSRNTLNNKEFKQIKFTRREKKRLNKGKKKKKKDRLDVQAQNRPCNTEKVWHHRQ